MSHIRVRPLERVDMEQMNLLHRTRDDLEKPSDAEKRTQLLEWLAFHNPFAGEENTYYAAEDRGTIVAYQGRMPMEFIINGARTKGYFVHDTYVHPDYRKMGLGFSLITALAQAIEQRSRSFFCVWGGTPLNLKIQRRMGYLELPPAPVYVKLLNPHDHLSKFVRAPVLVKLLNPLACMGLSRFDTFLMRGNAALHQTIPIDHFDHRFDELMNRVSRKLGICTYKGSAYLNWKYVDRPYQRDKTLALEEVDRIRGFVVMAFARTGGRKKGTIMEIVADPDDTPAIESLCRASIEYFRRQNAHSIRCVLSKREFRDIFRRFLFTKSSEGKSMLLGNMERVEIDRNSLIDTNRWHVSFGESDAFMLNL